MIFQAHKGVSTENPENTMPAFLAAVEQGYEIIELDVSVTKDMRFVTLHDSTINRTARNENGEPLQKPLRIDEITYEEALGYDFGVWFSQKFRGTAIPRLKEVLELARQHGISLKIDNKYQKFTPEQKEEFFKLLLPYEDVACLTCSDFEELRRAVAYFPKMRFHYDGPVSRVHLERIASLLSKERLTVWLPHKNPSTSWVKVDFANKSLARLVKQYATLGIWILSRNEHLEQAEALGAEIIETNGGLKPTPPTHAIADMHTHSEFSHDSDCPIEDMLKAQLDRGTEIFAVTDHFDTASYTRYDVFTPIASAFETVRQLGEVYGNRIRVLSGIEISEGFWHPEIYQKVRTLADYDVVIGSVHLVRYRDLTYATSAIDFSALAKEEIARYVDAYFDDILTMIDTVDFDILAHLTYPLRYIKGKFHVELDCSRYEEKIEEILRRIIKKGIALEVNTSSLGILGECMPPADLLAKYSDMGGYLITLGSDAHRQEGASYGFREALRTIEALGFKNIYYYKGRRPYPITIEGRTQS